RCRAGCGRRRRPPRPRPPRQHGTHLAWFASNNAYWQVRFEPSFTGQAVRTMVGDKYVPAETTAAPVARPGSTVLFRDATVNRPENALLGTMFENAYSFGLCNDW